MVCVQSAVTEGSMVIELPVKSMSSVLVKYWVTPCSLATLPVLTICWLVGQALTLSPLLLKLNDGDALPLVILDSENPWATCAMAGAAATSTTASIAANIINFFNFSTSSFSPLTVRYYC